MKKNIILMAGTVFFLLFTNSSFAQDFDLKKYDCENELFWSTKTDVSDFFDVDKHLIIGICQRTAGSLDLLFLDANLYKEVERVYIGHMSFYSIEVISKGIGIREGVTVKHASPSLVNAKVKSSKTIRISIGPKVPIRSPYTDIALVGQEWRARQMD